MAYVGESGWSRQQIQEFLYEKTRRPLQEWLDWKRLDHPAPGADPQEPRGCFADPGRITVVPGGGMAGAFIDIITSWGSSRSVTREIQTRF